MQIFKYRAINDNGLIIAGEIFAGSMDKAIKNLEHQGYLVKKITKKSDGNSIKKSVNKEDFTQFITEFIALNKAGLTVTEALEQSMKRPGNPGLSQALFASLKAIREGESLSGALEKYPSIFDDVLIASIKTGENSGNLCAPLEKYRTYLERTNTIKRKVTQALVYPIFILCAMVLILTALFIFVIPRFTALYADYDAALPAPTRVVFYIVGNMKIIAPAAAVGFFILFVSLSAMLKNKGIKTSVDSVFFKLPFVGAIIAPLTYSTFARSVSALLSGGMDLVESLKTASRGTTNLYYREKLEKVIKRVYGGEHFAGAAAEEKFLPETAIKLLEAGESSGTMDVMLSETASFYEQAAEARISAALTLIEPVMIFLTGILVGAVVIIMYLPVFKLTEIIK